MQVLLELGRAEALTNGPAARRHLREAYDALTDPLARGRRGRVLARALIFTGAPGRRQRSPAAPRRSSRPSSDDLRRALEAFELIAVLFGAREPEACLAGSSTYAAHAATDPGAGCSRRRRALRLGVRRRPGRRGVELALHALAGGELIAADNG